MKSPLLQAFLQQRNANLSDVPELYRYNETHSSDHRLACVLGDLADHGTGTSLVEYPKSRFRLCDAAPFKCCPSPS